jgi:imidazolonepropionase-like amidohydrolase
MASPEGMGMRKSIGDYPIDMSIARDNLVRAWKAGVTLITGSDAGNMLVFHGPTAQHEMELWVSAGIPAPVALTAATLNSARALRAGQRFGSIEKGKDATLLVVDGNPLVDIRATEAISFVMFKGERLNRAELLGQE